MKSLPAHPSPRTPRRVRYRRTSSEDQAERKTIEGQGQFLDDWGRLYQVQWVDDYADDGVTGTLLLDERPEGQRLLADAKAGRFDTVVVYRLDRLGRTLRALLDAHEQLARYGVTIQSATEPFDTSTPIGRFLFQLLASLAELERETMQDRLHLGRVNALTGKDGPKWTQGGLPYGFDADPMARPIKSEHAVDQLGCTEADLALDLFRRVAGGESGLRLAQWLTDLGVPSIRRYVGGTVRVDAAKWYPKRIATIIRNAWYKGDGHVDTKKGTVSFRLPTIVDADLWQRANDQMDRNQAFSPHKGKRVYLLRGKAFCSCGSPYVGHGSDSYVCSSIKTHSFADPHAKYCGGRRISARKLEWATWRALKERLRDPIELIEKAQQELVERSGRSINVDAQRATLRQRLAEKAGERERITELYRRKLINLDGAEAELRKVNEEEARERTLLGSLDAEEQLGQALEEHLLSVTRLLERMERGVDEAEGDPLKQQQLVDLLVQRLTLDLHDGRTDASLALTLPGPAVPLADSVLVGRTDYRTTTSCS